MHVCHVWDRFWPLQIGGLERYILWLSSYLAKNYDVDFSLITGRTKFLLITKNIKKFERSSTLEVFRLGPNPVDFVNGTLMYTLGYTPRFVDKIKFKGLCREAAGWSNTQSADVFHIHGVWKDLEYINLGIYLSRRFHKPLVLTLHGSFVGDPYDGGMPLESPVIKNILRNDVAAITTYSKEILSALQRLGFAEKSYLVTNFVDVPRFKKPNVVSNDHQTTVVYVGRLERVQTPEIVVEAFKKVNDKLPDAKLTLVGYGTLFDSIRSLIKQLNLENAVSMVGKQTDVRDFLWNSDVFVATNFGYIATLEAWSAGLAVVAPKFGVLKEIVAHGETGLLVNPNDADDLASALMTLIENKDLRTKVALNGAKAANEYDIREVAPKMVEIYQSVIKK
ncbi:MAG: glycosyltransferase family 4 protein [Candidatus Bathyarchaeota archaeon]|nr:glycosyltransferase family 4 protein [Candidatus Bathyarchaeota archaeon]